MKFNVRLKHLSMLKSNAGPCQSTLIVIPVLYDDHQFALGLRTSSTLLALPRLDLLLSPFAPGLGTSTTLPSLDLLVLPFALSLGTSTTLPALPSLALPLLPEGPALLLEPFDFMGNNFPFPFHTGLSTSSHTSSCTPP